MTRAELHTARLKLRPVAASDEAVVVTCLNDLAVTGWLAVVPHPYFPADFQHFQTQNAVPGETFAVDDTEGFAGILGVEDRTLGYWFAPRAHGHGYATEAARAALAEHFADNPADIASGYFEGNSRSANVLGKLGFVETGRGMKHCRALACERAHLEMTLKRSAFVAVLPVEARSERLTYRSLYATDAQALHDIVSHFEVVRQLASYPWPPESGFTRKRAQPYPGRGFVWGVFLEGHLVGTVAVTGDELGYMFAPQVWGRGFATEACKTAIAHAWQGRDHLIAGVWADNAASISLLHKLGFRITESDVSLNIARG
jgi:RimJ/RimL family protein N-acetyltransferase